jgi:rhodanese-related sulfurtransferase
MSVPTISPIRLDELYRSGESIELIDVRTPAEYRELHAAIARNVPLNRLNPSALVHAHEGSPRRPLYVICRSGSRAEQACRKLLAAGLASAVSVAGGTLAWDQAGLPVVRGRKTLSLERQVHIAAGSLVLLGAALALFVDPWFFALSAFVGAGLLFAGITNTCGMGLLLARMPWNQGRGDTPACCPAASMDVADAVAANTDADDGPPDLT